MIKLTNNSRKELVHGCTILLFAIDSDLVIDKP